MIQTIKLMKLRNSEFIQFFADIISLLKRAIPKGLNIQEQLKAVIESFEKMKAIHGIDRGSEISNELKEIDNKRDDAITGIRTVIEGYTYHYDKKIKEAAELLLNTIDNFGSSIARQNYPTQTTSLNGIVEKFTTEQDCKDAVSILHLEDWTLKMDKENQHFNKRYLDRVDEKAKNTVDKTKELRTSATEHYYELRDHLDAHATLNHTYQPLIDQLNKLIDEYNTIVKRRSGGRNGDEEE